MNAGRICSTKIIKQKTPDVKRFSLLFVPPLRGGMEFIMHKNKKNILTDKQIKNMFYKIHTPPYNFMENIAKGMKKRKKT